MRRLLYAILFLYPSLQAHAQTSTALALQALAPGSHWILNGSCTDTNEPGGLIWLDATPRPTCAQIAAYSPPATAPTSVVVISASAPALSGTYAFDATTQSKMLPVAAYIGIYQALPNGASTMQWPDTSGTMHTFNAAQFAALSKALTDYAFALVQGQSPASPVTIP